MMGRCCNLSRKSHRGTVMFAVLVVVTLAALTGTALVLSAGARVEDAAAGLKRTQSRAAAWSGVQAVMVQLESQRDVLLSAGAPTLDPEYRVFSDGGVSGVARLAVLARGQAGDETTASASPSDAAAEVWESENAKLDINVATAEMLAKLPGVTKELAGAIVAARGERGFGSVEELLRVPGMTAEILFGVGGAESATPGSRDDGPAATSDERAGGAGSSRSSRTGQRLNLGETPASTGMESGDAEPSEGDLEPGEEPGVESGAESGRESGLGRGDRRGADDAAGQQPSGGAIEDEPAVALASLLTTFSFDPNIQAGVGDEGEQYRGKLRIALSEGWSEDLGRGIAERFGDDAAQAAEQLFKNGAKFERQSQFVATLRQMRVPEAEWPRLLDAFTTTPDEYLTGRIDVNAASARVLRCVPGISEEAAAAIVRTREQLDAAQRLDVSWPVQKGILKGEEFEKSVDYLTTRSMQYRVRVEAGLVTRQASGPVVGAEEGRSVRVDDADTRTPRARGAGGGADSAEETPRHRVVLEAVIDVSSERARVAYMRDVTLMDAAALVRAATARGEEEREEETAGRAEDQRTSADVDAGTANSAAGAGVDGGIEVGADGDVGADLDMDAGLRLNEPAAGAKRGERPRAGADSRAGRESQARREGAIDRTAPRVRAGSRRNESNSSSAVATAASDSGAAPEGEVEPRAGVDRRFGRWTSRRPAVVAGAGAGGSAAGDGSKSTREGDAGGERP